MGKYNEINFSSYSKKIIFHPILESLSESNYEIWMNQLNPLTDDFALFAKSKPRMKEVHILKAIKI